MAIYPFVHCFEPGSQGLTGLTSSQPSRVQFDGFWGPNGLFLRAVKVEELVAERSPVERFLRGFALEESDVSEREVGGQKVWAPGANSVTPKMR